MTESTVSDGWRLIGRQMWVQRAGIAGGALAGLAWTAAKVSVPTLVARAIDQGIAPGDTGQILHYAGLIAVAGAFTAAFTGLRRYSGPKQRA